MLALLLAGLSLPGAPPQERGRGLAAKVERELLSIPAYGEFDWIGFSVEGREVVLQGFASRPELASELEQRLAGVEGVNSVENRIELLPQSSRDKGLRLFISRRLFRHQLLRRYDPDSGARLDTRRPGQGGVVWAVKLPIHIVVRDGEVTLQGYVETPEEKRAAGEAASQTKGVREVQNNLEAAGGESGEWPSEISGRVTIEGEPLTEGVPLRIVCGERVWMETYTEPDGRFSWQLGPVAPPGFSGADRGFVPAEEQGGGSSPAAGGGQAGQGGIPGAPGAAQQGPAAGQGSPGSSAGPAGQDAGRTAASGSRRRPVRRRAARSGPAPSGCRLEARLAGYVSRGGRIAVDGGRSERRAVRVNLEPIGEFPGSALSSTTATAPKKARKQYRKALDALRAQLSTPDPKAEEVVKHLRKAVENAPRFAAAWSLLGQALLWQDEKDEAEEAFRKATEADPRYLRPYRPLIGLLLEDQRWRQGAELAARLLDLNPHLTGVRHNYAVAQYNLDNLAAAEEAAQRVLSAPDAKEFPDAHYVLGAARARQGKAREARAAFEEFLRLAPDSPRAANLRKRIERLEEQGAFEDNAAADASGGASRKTVVSVQPPSPQSSGDQAPVRGAGVNGAKRRAEQQFGAQTLRVWNTSGSLQIKVTATSALRVRANSPEREIREGDVVTVKGDGLTFVRTQPKDEARIDLEVEIPYRSRIEAKTARGELALQGMPYRAKLVTEEGPVRLKAPWKAVRLALIARSKPDEVRLASGVEFSESFEGGGPGVWVLTTKHGGRLTHGGVVVESGAPPRVEIHDMKIPDDAAVKPHWLAPEELQRALEAARRSSGAPQDSSSGGSPEEARFRTEVRLVDLTVSVTDKKGNPVEGLTAADFEVIEDGEPQRISGLEPEEVPFNLVLLLDLSGSTEEDRGAIEAAAHGFISIARPQDRVAVYALADTRFHVLSPLTNNREQLLSSVSRIHNLAGGSPVYDAIALAYTQELARRPDERNALIVITDGVDNRLTQGAGMPSQLSFFELKEAAEEMKTLVYPVFLNPVPALIKGLQSQTIAHRIRWDALANLDRLAKASGGRLFRSGSLQELQKVYPEVGEEIRSVYRLAYQPSNQNFDGSWRKIRVKVKRSGVQVRTRDGYYAW